MMISTICFWKELLYLFPGPTTQLAKGYASLFQKTLRKGLSFCFLYVLDIGEKGSSFGRMSAKGYFFKHFHWKRVIFWCFKSAFFNKMGFFFPQEKSVIGVFFSFGERSYVPPFTCEGPDRDLFSLGDWLSECYL